MYTVLLKSFSKIPIIESSSLVFAKQKQSYGRKKMAYGSNPYGGFSAYREIGVKTASQGKLVVLLYEAAVRSEKTA